MKRIIIFRYTLHIILYRSYKDQWRIKRGIKGGLYPILYLNKKNSGYATAV